MRFASISGKWVPGLALLFFLLALPACKNKDDRKAEPWTGGEQEQTRPYKTVQDVKVRSGPGTRYKIIAEIKADTTVHVTGREGEWLRVVSKHGRPPGYIDQRFAKPAEPDSVPRAKTPTGTYKTTAAVSVREGPGLHYRSVARIDKDTVVTVVGDDGDWLKVQSKHGNPPGYIEKRYAERAPG